MSRLRTGHWRHGTDGGRQIAVAGRVRRALYERSFAVRDAAAESAAAQPAESAAPCSGEAAERTDAAAADETARTEALERRIERLPDHVLGDALHAAAQRRLHVAENENPHRGDETTDHQILGDRLTPFAADRSPFHTATRTSL